MEMIITDASKRDVGVVKGFQLDMAYGIDENSFELKAPLQTEVFEIGSYVYSERTEYGGIIDAIMVDTGTKEITYSGRTWQGIFDSKIICPPRGADYYIAAGTISDIVNGLIANLGLSGLFMAQSSDANLYSYQFDRYCTGYAGGLLRWLASIGKAATFVYYDGMVTIDIKDAETVGGGGEISPESTSFKIKKADNKVNHLICLGKGELKDRTVIHLYSDSNGNISSTQTYSGLDEIASVYDYPAVESLDELRNGGISQLTELRAETENSEVNVRGNDFAVGDIVNETEPITGCAVNAKISKKIITATDNDIQIEYKTGGMQ